MKFFMAILLSLCVSSTVYARNIKMILSNPPGSTTDILARAFAQSYFDITGDTIHLQYVPGGNHIVAVTAFQSASNDTVLFGSTTMHIYNPVLEKNLPYQDSDFRHVAFIAHGPAFYVTRSNSKIKKPKDLVQILPESSRPFVGGYAHSYNLSVSVLNRHTKKPIEVVMYKGGPDVSLALLNDTIDVGLFSVTSNTFELVKSGQLHIIGSTHHEDIVYQGIHVPSVSKALKIPQTSGGYLLSLKSNVDPEFAAEFERVSQQALKSKIMKDAIQKSTTFAGTSFGHSNVSAEIEKSRNVVRQISNKEQQ